MFRRLGGTLPKQAAIAVNLDPDESDPATISLDQLRARFGRRPLVICENPGELPAVIRRLREGTGLRDGLLAALLVVLVFEVFLANRRGGKWNRQSLPRARPPRAALLARRLISPRGRRGRGCPRFSFPYLIETNRLVTTGMP